MLSETFQITTSQSDIGKRIDKLISEKFDSLSRSQIKKSFDENLVFCNANVVRGKYNIKGGEIITFRLLLPSPPRVEAQKMPLKILFEDSDIIVLDKPADIVVHPGSGTNAATFVEGVLAHCPLSALGGELRPGVVHRLDKETSGAIIFAKTDTAYLRLIKMFANRDLEKSYQTIVEGAFDKSFGEICQPIGRNTAKRTQMAVTARGKEALTRWRLIKNFGRQFAHLHINILTGRTHQIRVHMAHVGHHVLGDFTYGYRKNQSSEIIPKRVMLHAHGLKFQHPCTAHEIAIQCPLPEDFVEMLSLLSSAFGENLSEY